jgi:hypothetical protein
LNNNEKLLIMILKKKKECRKNEKSEMNSNESNLFCKSGQKDGKNANGDASQNAMGLSPRRAGGALGGRLRSPI